MLREGNQTQKPTYCIIPFIDLPSSKAKTVGLESRSFVARHWGQGKKLSTKEELKEFFFFFDIMHLFCFLIVVTGT